LVPENFTAPESSGSALFCYAIAWSINNGILNKETYSSVAEKAWQGLVSCVNDSGVLLLSKTYCLPR
jgi:unsaturated rhamnogalacturonyl hydrolase